MASDLKKMAETFLVRYGYGGLCNPDAECGCDLADLMYCLHPSETGCRAAYRFDCARCMDGPNQNNDCPYNEGFDYMMATVPDFCHPVYVGGEG